MTILAYIIIVAILGLAVWSVFTLIQIAAEIVVGDEVDRIRECNERWSYVRSLNRRQQ